MVFYAIQKPGIPLKKNIEELEVVDRQLMRHIIGAHAKAPVEFLYLETGVIPLQHVISCRRLLYLKNILQREDNELIKRIYKAQLDNPVKGDWCELVQKDLEDLDLNTNQVELVGTDNYKEKVKEKIKRLAFSDLKELQKSHKKINNIEYKCFKAQPYIKNHIMNNGDISLLFSLRCRTVRNIKANFPTMYFGNVLCQLGCQVEETQEHCFQCPAITQNKERNSSVEYADIFGNPDQQVTVTREFRHLLEEREALLQQRETLSLPVGPLDPDITVL